MIDDEELATAPDYRWRRYWNQFWLLACVTLFLGLVLVTWNWLVAVILTAVFFFTVDYKAKQWDAAERGSAPEFDKVVEAALKRHRDGDAR